jgi:hypothetical protein
MPWRFLPAHVFLFHPPFQQRIYILDERLWLQVKYRLARPFEFLRDFTDAFTARSSEHSFESSCPSLKEDYYGKRTQAS